MIIPTTTILLLPLTLALSLTPPHPRSRAHSRLSSAPTTNSLALNHNKEHHAARRRGEGEWLVREKGRLRGKYDEGSRKRAQGSLTLADQDKDASYSATIAVGSSSQTFEVALDTGSADLWLLSTECSLPTCDGLDTFDPTASTTYRNGSTQFSIAYGSGSAQGHLGSDTVTLGGFSVQGQTFGVVSSMSSGLIDTPLSGLMGLGFKSLAVTGATPWWQSLATSGAWTDPLFGFYMKRYRDVETAVATEPDGGEVTLGYVDGSLYEGDIEWVSVDAGKQSYWNIPIAGLSMQGTTVQVTAANAAIDTGTTLIGGPETDVAALYAAIPGSREMTGSYAGYYEYPCSTPIDMTMTFGSHVVTINEDDFNIGSYSSDDSYCTGGVYVQGLSSSSAVQWVVGDTMLKNVYSLYRYSPAAVGFASLPGSGSGSNSSSASSSASSSSSSTASAVASASSGSTSASSSSATSSSSSVSPSSASTIASSSSSLTTSSAPVVVVTATATADLTGSTILQSTLVGGGGAGDATASLVTPAASATTSMSSAETIRLPHLLGSLGMALVITLTLF